MPRTPLAGGLLALLTLPALPPVLPAQADALRDKVKNALDLARPALMAHLRELGEGRIGRPGELALVVLAAIHDGVEVGDPLFDKALRKLGNANPAETYDLALRLVVIESCPTFPDRLDTARADVKELLKHRDDRGGFGYGPDAPNWDLSNTQYAAPAASATCAARPASTATRR